MPKSLEHRRYNSTNICDRIKEDGSACAEILSPGKSYKEKDKNGILTGRWICSKCYAHGCDRKRDRKGEYRKLYMWRVFWKK